jgi:ankyrin repeat protein
LLFIKAATPSVINWQDYEGCTALHLAVADGNEAVVAALVIIIFERFADFYQCWQ